jgi:hypothetical protein
MKVFDGRESRDVLVRCGLQSTHAIKNSRTAVCRVLGVIDDRSFPVGQRRVGRPCAASKLECCPQATLLDYDNAMVKDENDEAVWVNSNAAFDVRMTKGDRKRSKDLPVASAQHVPCPSPRRHHRHRQRGHAHHATHHRGGRPRPSGHHVRQQRDGRIHRQHCCRLCQRARRIAAAAGELAQWQIGRFAAVSTMQQQRSLCRVGSLPRGSAFTCVSRS